MNPESIGGISGDLGGTISVKLKEGKKFNDYCRNAIPGYNSERLEAFAIRIFYGKELIVTVYAVDHAEKNSDKNLPVKKFKMNVTSLQEILSYVEECNFTITTGNYQLDEMEVINK
jgi:hypothetical protein